MDRARVIEVLEAAVESPTEERAGLLDEYCDGDDEVRHEVERLLALEDRADGFLDGSAVDFKATREPEAIERIGPYRVTKALGKGGMGIVYLAVREDDFEKKVAIKVLRRGLATGVAVRRFHAERQILARLEHPSIGRLLDGGSLPDGRPYLVIEHVEGLPVDCYAGGLSLGLRPRLELFVRICEAVAYAHRNLVVHRDLKPGNILVTAKGVPKLLDFGIAKLLDPDEDAAADITLATSPMTPRYASPEQVLGETITTATDIWALGLLLHELVTLRLPLGLADCPKEEVRRRICAAEAEPPSRLAPLPSLRRRLAGDVDAIVLEALRKEPAERYASAEQMAADVRRYLDGEPVAARRGRWLYRAGKLVRRRPWAVLAAILVVASSFVSTGLWRQSVEQQRLAAAAHRRAVHEQAAAVRQQERAERVSDFLARIFRSAGPDAVRGGRLTVREALDAGRERLAEDLEGEPELEAELAGTLGDVYRDLGLWEEAVELQRRAVELWRGLYPQGDPRLAVALNDLASVLYYMEYYADAEVLLRESLALRRQFGGEPAQIARALNNLASTVKQQDRLDEAGALYGEALAIRESIHGGDHPSVAASLYSLGSLRFDEGRVDAAEPLLRRALAIYTSVHGERHTRVASVLATLGRLLHARGELAEAADVLRRALAIREELLGEEHPHTVATREALGAVIAGPSS